MKYTIDYVIRLESDTKPAKGDILRIEIDGAITPIKVDLVDPRTLHLEMIPAAKT